MTVDSQSGLFSDRIKLAGSDQHQKCAGSDKQNVKKKQKKKTMAIMLNI